MPLIPGVTCPGRPGDKECAHESAVRRGAMANSLGQMSRPFNSGSRDSAT